MADAALFVGWGPVIHGREKQSLAVFSEILQYYGRLQQQGDIESFEPVALEQHGGDLWGFVLVRGDRAKLERIRYSEEFLRLVNRGVLVVDSLGVVGAFIGEGLNRLFTDFQTQAAELA